MSSGPETPSYHTSEDERLLHKLGYAQELFRAMGGFRNFAISFTIISILAGCLTSYWVAFERGGPVAVTWGWLLVGVMATIVALAMAEIASAYPTAGGLYYWASKLGSPGWGWATGWFNLIGQVAVTASIGYGLATFAQVLFTSWFDYGTRMDDAGISYNGQVFILYVAFMLAAVLINVFDIRITSGLNMISAWWHMIGVAVIVFVLIIVPDNHQSVSYVFTETVNNSGYGGGTTAFSNPAFWFVLGLGLLMSQYTMTGFDASAHTAEETHAASRMAAVGMWTSVFVSMIFGWILLLAVTFAIPDTQGALDNIGAVVPWIWTESMSEGWSDALLFICVIAQFFCVTASVTSASRMMFAFSRDGAVPGHQLWRRVSRHRVPIWSVFGIGVFSVLLMVPAIWNYLVGYAAGTAIAVIGLYIAFILPVILRLRLGDTWDEPRAWSLGRWYKLVDWIAILWVALVTILFVFPLYKAGLPWESDFSWELTNYTILWFIGIGIVFGGWWFVSAKNWFKGPVRMGTEEELERLEAKTEDEFRLPADTQYGS
jgi:amino acid transporter